MEFDPQIDLWEIELQHFAFEVQHFAEQNSFTIILRWHYFN